MGLQKELVLFGLQGTTCNQRIEPIDGTKHARILRVPFRSKDGIAQRWISRSALTRTPISVLCYDVTDRLGCIPTMLL